MAKFGWALLRGSKVREESSSFSLSLKSFVLGVKGTVHI
jgi:hypothetical protein